MVLTGAEFLQRLQLFFDILETDITSTAVTTISFTLTQVSVELTEEEKTLIEEKQKTLSSVSSQISQAITFYSTQFETLTGEAVSKTQILAGDPETGIDTVALGNEKSLETMSQNAESVEKTGMLCKAIAEDPIEATSSGTVDMDVMDLFMLVQELYTLLSEDFLYGGRIAILMMKIESGRLSTSLTKEQTTMVTNTIARLDALSFNIRTSMAVLNTQYLTMTGIEYVVETAAVVVKESAEAIADSLLVDMKAIQMSGKVGSVHCTFWLILVRKIKNWSQPLRLR